MPCVIIARFKLPSCRRVINVFIFPFEFFFKYLICFSEYCTDNEYNKHSAVRGKNIDKMQVCMMLSFFQSVWFITISIK